MFQATPRLTGLGVLYSLLAATLMMLAGAAWIASGHLLLEMSANGLGVLILFGGMKVWVHANRVALALSVERRCCTSPCGSCKILSDPVTTGRGREDTADTSH